MSKYKLLILLNLLFISQVYGQEKDIFLNVAYPNPVSGILTYATLTKLPPGDLVKAGSVVICEKDFTKSINNIPQYMRDKVLRHPFFVLEQEATSKIISALAKKEKKYQVDNDTEVVQKYLTDICRDVTVSKKEIKDFFDANKQYFYNTTFEQVSGQIKQYLLEQHMLMRRKSKYWQLALMFVRSRHLFSTIKKEKSFTRRAGI